MEKGYTIFVSIAAVVGIVILGAAVGGLLDHDDDNDSNQSSGLKGTLVDNYDVYDVSLNLHGKFLNKNGVFISAGNDKSWYEVRFTINDVMSDSPSLAVDLADTRLTSEHISILPYDNGFSLDAFGPDPLKVSVYFRAPSVVDSWSVTFRGITILAP